MRVKEIVKKTDNRFLNMYDYIAETKSGKPMTYFVASRAKDVSELKLHKGISADAAIIYAIKDDKMVVIKQYRYSIDDYCYELPAGLVDEGETFAEAAVRELKEETGLDLHVLPCPAYFNQPLYTSVGMSDEMCATVFGEASGEISYDGLEDSEDLTVMLVDREEAKKILEEGKVTFPVGYMMMHYISSKPNEALKFLEVK